MRRIRVLIVDDEPKVALTLAAALEKLGTEFVADTAHSFAEAFSKVRRNRYALLVTGYKMPGLNGLDLAQAARQVSPDTRIVLMTAYGTPKLRATIQLLGLAGYLEKPFTMAQLREQVVHAVNDLLAARHVLLVEDKDGLRHLYGDALRSAGYIVYEATSHQEARDLLDRHWFDVFLCALPLGDEHGTSFVREQRAKLSQVDTHLIVISPDGAYRSVCEQMGIEFYLEMPVATGPLVTLVDRLTAMP